MPPRRLSEAFRFVSQALSNPPRQDPFANAERSATYRKTKQKPIKRFASTFGFLYNTRTEGDPIAGRLVPRSLVRRGAGAAMGLQGLVKTLSAGGRRSLLAFAAGDFQKEPV